MRLSGAERIVVDKVVISSVGDVGTADPGMMKTYSHIRREALNQGAAALKPSKPTKPKPQSPTLATPTPAPPLVSESMSQKRISRGRLIDFCRKSGSPQWTISAIG